MPIANRPLFIRRPLAGIFPKTKYLRAMELPNGIEDFQDDIESCLAALQTGGLILYPTDTIWGIGCDATNEAAVEKIYRIKKRPDKKKMIILLADEKDLLTYVTQPDLRIFDYIKEIQKPTTVIYEGGIGIADNLINSDGTVAIRI